MYLIAELQNPQNNNWPKGEINKLTIIFGVSDFAIFVRAIYYMITYVIF